MQLISTEELDSITRMAMAAFSIDEIIEVLDKGCEPMHNLFLEEGPVKKAYRKGILQRKLELNERIFLDARNGSSPAQAQAIKLLEQMELENRL